MSIVTEEVKRTRTAAEHRPPRESSRPALVPESEPYVLTSAETAECSCPDVCERDHDNE